MGKWSVHGSAGILFVQAVQAAQAGFLPSWFAACMDCWLAGYAVGVLAG